MSTDAWGVARYESTAQELAPVAERAVQALALRGGEQVLDVACGTGNAAAVALGLGAVVTGLDASERLAGVAQERLPEATIVVGDAVALPFEDGAFDAAVSVFGVIFARPARRAIAELARVVRPGGRVVVSSWVSRGPMFEAVMVMRRAMAAAQGPPPEDPEPVDWGDPDALRAVFAPYGELTVTEHQLARPDTAPEDQWARWETEHPMWVGARAVLEPAGRWEQVRADTIAAVRDTPGGGPYLLSVLERSA